MKKKDFLEYIKITWNRHSDYEIYDVVEKLNPQSYIKGYIEGRDISSNLFPKDYYETLLDIVKDTDESLF